MDNPYLTADEVSVLLRKSTKWIYQRASEIPGAFKLGGCWFFDREILAAGLKELASKPAKGKVPAPFSSASNRHNL